MKSKYVWHAGQWVDVTHWKPPPRRTPYIIRDSMDAMQHPATGEVFDSKSRFREVTRANGLVEMGSDAPICRNSGNDARAQEKGVTDALVQAYAMLEQGYQPPPNESLADWGETRILGGE
jgi:hypothetical protein